MASTKEILHDIPPVIRIYTDGSFERLYSSPFVPPSPEGDPTTGVFSKDTTTTPPTRLYLPCRPTTGAAASDQKLPVLVYFHGSGFCVESAFSFLHQRYLNILSSEAKALIVSVEYRLAPEHPLPAAYEDSWAALKWVCSHLLDETHLEKEPWIANHADLSRIFVVGDSAGGNIAHNMAIRAGSDHLPGNAKILGAVLSHPYFWGSAPVGSETGEDKEQSVPAKIWIHVAYPNAPGGIDNPFINPIVDGAPELSGLGCEKIFVCVSEKDQLTGQVLAYVDKVRESGWWRWSRLKERITASKQSIQRKRRPRTSSSAWLLSWAFLALPTHEICFHYMPHV